MIRHIVQAAAATGIAATVALVIRQAIWEKRMIREHGRSGSPW
jgi:predicted cobalt transporter CbtA